MALPVLLRLASLSGKGRDFPTKPEISRRITSSIEFNVKSDYKRLERRLNAIERKQLPFAFSKTLNDVAKRIRKRIVDRTYPAAFDVRDGKFANATFKIDFSSKRKLEARVYDRLGRANLKLHAEGGIKRAKRGSIAVPSQYVKDRRTGRGVRRSLRPREVVDSQKGYKTQRAIFQAYGPKASKKRLLYSLIPSARISKQFPFYEDANKIVRKDLSRVFNYQLKQALRSRKG
jgi:hypothetical protein